MIDIKKYIIFISSLLTLFDLLKSQYLYPKYCTDFITDNCKLCYEGEDEAFANKCKFCDYENGYFLHINTTNGNKETCISLYQQLGNPETDVFGTSKQEQLAAILSTTYQANTDDLDGYYSLAQYYYVQYFNSGTGGSGDQNYITAYDNLYSKLSQLKLFSGSNNYELYQKNNILSKYLRTWHTLLNSSVAVYSNIASHSNVFTRISNQIDFTINEENTVLILEIQRLFIEHQSKKSLNSDTFNENLFSSLSALQYLLCNSEMASVSYYDNDFIGFFSKIKGKLNLESSDFNQLQINKLKPVNISNADNVQVLASENFIMDLTGYLTILNDIDSIYFGSQSYSENKKAYDSNQVMINEIHFKEYLPFNYQQESVYDEEYLDHFSDVVKVSLIDRWTTLPIDAKTTKNITISMPIFEKYQNETDIDGYGCKYFTEANNKWEENLDKVQIFDYKKKSNSEDIRYLAYCSMRGYFNAYYQIQEFGTKDHYYHRWYLGIVCGIPGFIWILSFFFRYKKIYDRKVPDGPRQKLIYWTVFPYFSIFNSQYFTQCTHKSLSLLFYYSVYFVFSILIYEKKFQYKYRHGHTWLLPFLIMLIALIIKQIFGALKMWMANHQFIYPFMLLWLIFCSVIVIISYFPQDDYITRTEQKWCFGGFFMFIGQDLFVTLVYYWFLIYFKVQTKIKYWRYVELGQFALKPAAEISKDDISNSDKEQQTFENNEFVDNRVDINQIKFEPKNY